MANRSTKAPGNFSGLQVIWAGLMFGSAGLTISLFLHTIVARTPVRLPSNALFWLAILLSGMGALAGMAVESVRQLQSNSPDPEYHLSQLQQRLAAERRQRRQHPP